MASSPDNAASTSAARDPQSLFRLSLKNLDDRLKRGEPFSGHERNCLFLNTGDARWATVSHVSGFDFDDDARALAATDWDGDGDVDVWVANRTAPMVRYLRNDTPRAGDFVSLQLKQDAGNRDAIGARVEVKLVGWAGALPHQVLVREIRAGDSYLSQSSLRLHFGLGPKAQISEVTVRWPGGARESFTGVQPNAAWLLLRSTGKAVAAPARQSLAKLTPGPVTLPLGEFPVAVPLAHSIPLPRIDFTDLSGKPRQLSELKGSPVLVTLVSGDFPACAAQLDALKDHLPAGLRHLAAGMDDAPETRSLLTFRSGGMDRGILTVHARERLETLYNAPFEIELHLTAPTSFLLDANLRLLTLYRGPVSAAQLAADIKRANSSATELEASAMPFSGTWFRPPAPWAPFELLPVILRQSDWVAADDYMTANRAEFATSRRYAGVAKVLADALIAQNLIARALPHYQDALKDYAADPILLNNLAHCLLHAQENPDVASIAAALTHATKAAELTTHQDAALLDTLARAQLAAGRKPDAIATVLRALALEGATPEVIRGLEELQSLLAR